MIDNPVDKNIFPAEFGDEETPSLSNLYPLTSICTSVADYSISKLAWLGISNSKNQLEIGDEPLSKVDCSINTSEGFVFAHKSERVRLQDGRYSDSAQAVTLSPSGHHLLIQNLSRTIASNRTDEHEYRLDTRLKITSIQASELVKLGLLHNLPFAKYFLFHRMERKKIGTFTHSINVVTTNKLVGGQDTRIDNELAAAMLLSGINKYRNAIMRLS